MSDELREVAGTRILLCAIEGPAIRNPQDANDLIGAARSESAELVALPMERLDPAFFQLRTGLAGEILQKFVNYRVRLAILGDFTQPAADSTALRDLIRESNSGRTTWFLPDVAELEARLMAP
jgi:hypothetical protein